LAGKAALSAEEAEHLEGCADCSGLALEFRRVIEHHGDIAKLRSLIVEEQDLPADEEQLPPTEAA
jgi:hypothetical protein